VFYIKSHENRYHSVQVVQVILIFISWKVENHQLAIKNHLDMRGGGVEKCLSCPSKLNSDWPVLFLICTQPIEILWLIYRVLNANEQCTLTGGCYR